MYIILLKFPKKTPALIVKINRELKKMNAKKIQNSVWKSENLKGLTKIAVWINNAGGKSRIIEEKIVY